MLLKIKNINLYIAGWRFPCLIFVLSLLLCAFLSSLNDIPERDVAGRYAVMAEAFAAGDWDYAFHPRIPPLMPCCAGVVVWLTGCSGFVAAKTVSILFFAACIFPLYGIFLRTFNENIARWGCVLLMFSSHLLRIAVSGLRDSSKGLAIIIACYAILCIWQQRTRLAGYLWCIAGAVLLTLTRGDCVLYAVLFLAAAFIFELYRQRSFFLPWRTILAFILYLFCLSPQLTYNYRMIGYPVPEVRYGMILNRFERWSGVNIFYNPDAVIKLPDMQTKEEMSVKTLCAAGSTAAASSNIFGDSSPVPQNGYSVTEFIDSLFKGFYPYFFLFAVPVIVMRIYRRDWKVEESILLAILLGHAFLIVIQIIIFDNCLYVSRRYLIPVAPVAFGWSAIGMLVIWGWLRSKIPVLEKRAAAPLVFAGCAIALLADSAGPVIKDYTSCKKNTERMATIQVAELIRKDFGGRAERINRGLVYFTYRSNRSPLIISDLPVVGYWSGGQNINTEDADVKCGRIRPDYIVFAAGNDEKEKQYPGFNLLWRVQINNTRYDLWKQER